MSFKKGIIPWNKGKKGVQPSTRKGTKQKPHSEETKIKMSIAQKRIGNMPPHFMGEKSSHWGGDDVGYYGLHKWLYKMFGFPDKCEECGFESNNHRKIHWANLSGLYKRVRSDWRRLCVSCHKKFDLLRAI